MCGYAFKARDLPVAQPLGGAIGQLPETIDGGACLRVFDERTPENITSRIGEWFSVSVADDSASGARAGRVPRDRLRPARGWRVETREGSGFKPDLAR